MDPNFWGSGLWKAIHAMAATTETSKERMDFKNMMMELAKILPCKVCRKHLTENMAKHPIERYMKSNETLFLWTYLLHDSVNQAQKKTGNKRPNFKDVYNTYFESNKSKNNEVNYTFQDGICSEICQGQQVTSSSNSLSNSSSTSNQKLNSKSSYTTKFKSRRRY